MKVPARRGGATVFDRYFRNSPDDFVSGIGFSIEWSRELLLTKNVLAWVAVVGVLGLLTDRTALWAQRALVPWSHPIGGTLEVAR